MIFRKREWDPNFKIDHYFRTQIILLQIIGMWPINYAKYLPNSLKFLSWYFNLLFFIIVNFVLLHMCILIYITFYQNLYTGTIGEITGYISLIVIYTFASFIVIFFDLYYRECYAFIKYMNQNFRHRSAKGLTYVTIEPVYRFARIFSVLWNFSTFFGVVHWSLYPIQMGVRMLPVTLWYPFIEDSLAFPYYQILYAVQAYAQILVGAAFANAGAVLISGIFLVAGQYDILFCSLKNILYTAMIHKGNAENELKKLQSEIDYDSEEVNQYFYSYEFMEDSKVFSSGARNPTTRERKVIRQCSPSHAYLMDYDEELTEALIECIHQHQMMTEFIVLLDAYFSQFNLIKSMQITFQICNLAFTATKTLDSGSISKYINLTEYLVLTVAELFLFCFAGETLIHQSTMIGSALLRGPWYQYSGPFRQKILMILENTKKPKLLTGGTFFVLDYGKLKSVIKASFSWYTLLQRIGD